MRSFHWPLALIGTLFLSSGLGAISADEKYFSFGSPIIEEVKETATYANPLTPAELGLETPFEGITLGNIVNLGKAAWALIEAGKPVVNLATDAASALPEGIRTWQELEGWKPPVSKTYKVSYTNGFGFTVVSFTYRVLATYGASFHGKGRYLTRVTVVPANVEVSWGYKFSAKVEVPSVTNEGTMEDPIAAAQLQVNWTVETIFKHQQSANNYYVTGKGELTEFADEEDDE